MKTMLSKWVALLIAVCFVASCSTNTQNQNTGLGAVTGGVVGGLAGSLVGGGTGKAVAIGVGIVAGALIGGYVGHSVDVNDQSHMNQTMDSNVTNQSSAWTNKSTNVSYTLTPVTDKMAYKGNSNCRKYNATSSLSGKTKRTHGIACRQANGNWQVVK
jgi:surface antigen